MQQLQIVIVSAFESSGSYDILTVEPATVGKGKDSGNKARVYITLGLATSGLYPVGKHGLFLYRAYTARCLVLFTRGSETSGYVRVIGEHVIFADAHLHFSQ